MEDRKESIGNGVFQMTLDKNTLALSNGDVLDKGWLQLQVISEPELKKIEKVSRWRIVNWWWKITNTGYENVWVYTVKIVG